MRTSHSVSQATRAVRDPVVVGVDNSPAGTAALRWAEAEAADRGATLRVIRVHDPRERADLALERDPSAELDAVRRRLFTQVTDRLQDDRPERPRVVVTAARGPLVPTLARAAHGAAMLVIGRPVGPDHLNLPEQLSRRCACPVVVIDEEGEGRHQSGGSPLTSQETEGDDRPC
jgi:nucleotide-binding universal stress UspA family protein